MSNSRTDQFRVIPGLSISNKELRARITNRSIVINQNGKQYSVDPEVISAIRSSKVENARAFLQEEAKIASLNKSIQEDLRQLKITEQEELKALRAKAKGGENEA